MIVIVIHAFWEHMTSLTQNGIGHFQGILFSIHLSSILYTVCQSFRYTIRSFYISANNLQLEDYLCMFSNTRDVFIC